MKGKYSKINQELNALEIYKNLSCSNCGRKYPDTILNIEEKIHHNSKKGYRCVDTLACNQARKKIKNNA